MSVDVESFSVGSCVGESFVPVFYVGFYPEVTVVGGVVMELPYVPATDDVVVCHLR